MKFRIQEKRDFNDLLYFDSWESERWVPILYYLTLALLWLFCTLFTLYCCVLKGNIGLFVSISTSLILLPCGVLTIRLFLEIALSVFGIRDSLGMKESEKLLKDDQEQGKNISNSNSSHSKHSNEGSEVISEESEENSEESEISND